MGDVDDAWVLLGRQLVEEAVDRPERPSGDLGGERHDAGEERRRLAGAADDVPAGLVERRVDRDRVEAGRAQRDVRDAAMGADGTGDPVLEAWPAEDDRQAAAAGARWRAAVVPHLVGLVPGAGRGQVQVKAADRRDERVAGRPRGDPVGVVQRLVLLQVGRAGVARGAEHGDVVRGQRGFCVGAAQRPQLALGEGFLGGAEALADHIREVVRDHVLLGRDDLREPAGALVFRGRRLDEDDLGVRGHGVGPFDIKRRLGGPVGHGRVVRVELGDQAGRVDDAQCPAGH